MTEKGLYCEVGNFYIDPLQPVDRAVITHAHGDHARRECRRYLAAREGLQILRLRLGNEASIQTVPYGEHTYLDGIRVSLHPAGHILGSSQVRIEYRGRITVVSGDYKVQTDPTCGPLEVLRCHTFTTESTFGLPVYRWPEPKEILGDINAWWSANRAAGRPSLLYAYAAGKAQRIIMGLDISLGPVFTHRSVEELNRRYRASGVALPDTISLDFAGKKPDFSSALIVAPPLVHGTEWTKPFRDCSTGFASGWMRIRGLRRRRSVDRGFVLSDHVDWPGLLSVISSTGAEEILVCHGYTAVVVRTLREMGLDAKSLDTPFAADEKSEN
ncbi:MAG TPA: ligase-associated DNA damage response exonuclease [Syntrophales bacterium]|nr:ligase-associated DNA damage response exonuclease [Syntrophales bacterium]HOX94277.1 ligase-associated DNA damage response exonuclease [Syntrophales bacterium]HPI56211.1 ligase-associated DNA damage response exonuclease [Syntrophales bacterium]HPN24399.1 ligase-associated DNA damage response exonuclease [Syntrophales bacterium]HQM29029.1 ligase-associated DNA damage response exonuclease [Syntrophales bacterium]